MTLNRNLRAAIVGLVILIGGLGVGMLEAGERAVPERVAGRVIN